MSLLSQKENNVGEGLAQWVTVLHSKSDNPRRTPSIHAVGEQGEHLGGTRGGSQSGEGAGLPEAGEWNCSGSF